MTDFKVGDKVVVVEDTAAPSLIKGETYIVKEVLGQGFLRIGEKSGVYRPDRFELVVESEPELFYMIGPGIMARSLEELKKRQVGLDSFRVVPVSAIREFRRESTFVEVTE